MAEDGGFQLAQRRARLESELVDELRAESLVGLEGVGLPTRPVQSDDQLGPEALPEGMQPDERLQLTHHFAMPPQRQLRLRPAVGGRPPQLPEPRRLGDHEGLVADVGQYRSAPQPERLPERRRRLGRPTGLGALPPSATNCSNRPASDCSGRCEQVAGRPG